MQLKIRVRRNDNERVEEWWPVEQVMTSTTLPATLDSLIRSATLLADLAEAHDNELSAIHGLEGSLIERVNQLEGENIRLAKRLERLEQILAKNGSPEAIELRSQLIGEVNGRYVGEEPEPNGARFREEEEPDERLFDAVDDLLYDAETNSYPRGRFNAEHLDALREVFLTQMSPLTMSGMNTNPDRW